MLTDLKVAAETLQSRPVGQVARLTFLHAPGEVLGKRYHMSRGKVVKKGAPNVATFHCHFREASTPYEFFALLSRAEKFPDICLIRAKPGKWIPRDGKPVHRLKQPQPGHVTPAGTRVPEKVMREQSLEHNVTWLPHWEDQATEWVMLDAEGVEAPDGAAWLMDPQGTAEWFRDNCLPPSFQGVTCWVQITGSARDPGDPDGWSKVRLRFGFWLDRGLTSPELHGLLDGFTGIDPCTLDVHQPIYTANPVFRGLPDPVTGPRSFILEGEDDTVELPAEIRPKRSKLARANGDTPVRTVVEGAPGAGLVDPLPEPFLEALERVTSNAGECRSRLGTAAYVYALSVGVDRTDIKALTARLVEEGEKYRSPGEVAGYGLESLVHWRLGMIPPPDPDPFDQPAGQEEAEPGPDEQAEAETTVEQASEQLRATVRKWIEDGLDYHPDLHTGVKPVPRVAIRAAAGLGKTTAALELLAEIAAGKTVYFLVPTHKLAEELLAKAEGIGIPSIVLQGRSRPDPSAPDQRMCLKHELAEKVAEAGMPVYESICEDKDNIGIGNLYHKCQYFEHCSYIRQFKGAEGRLIIMPHQWLTLPRRKLPDPDLVIVDERFFDVGVRSSFLPFSRIVRPLRFGVQGVDYARHKATAEAVSKALREGQHPREHGVKKADLKAAGDAEKAAWVRKMVAPGMPERDQRRLVQEFVDAAEHRRLTKIYRLLEEDFDLDRPSVRVHAVKGIKVEGETVDRVYTHWTDFQMPKASTLLIDADVDPVITDAILPGVETVEIKPPMQAKIMQVMDTPCSRRKLTEADAAAKNLARIAALARREAAHGPVLLVSYKPAIEAIGEVDGVDTIHFGDLRGLDQFKGHKTVIIAGREQTRAVVMEGYARALFPRADPPLDLPGEYVQGRRRYRTRDGSPRVGPVHLHPDPRVQAIVEQYRECETEQAFARVRPIHRTADNKARGFLLSMMPCPGLIVDEFVSWSALLPDKVEQAVQESEGVELLTPSELARCYPDRWPTTAAAKMYRQRRKLVTKSLIGFYGEMLPVSPRLVSYRTTTTGTRGPAPRASIPATMSKAEAEAALAAIVGPLAVIEYDVPERDEEAA